MPRRVSRISTVVFSEEIRSGLSISMELQTTALGGGVFQPFHLHLHLPLLLQMRILQLQPALPLLQGLIPQVLLPEQGISISIPIKLVLVLVHLLLPTMGMTRLKRRRKERRRGWRVLEIGLIRSRRSCQRNSNFRWKSN